MIDFVIEPPDRPRRWPCDPQTVPLPVDLQELLGDFIRFPCLARLKDLGVYDATPIDGEWLEGLINDLSQLLDLIEKGDIRVIAPDRVGVTFDEDVPMDFGLEGFIQWARDLLSLAQRAQTMKIPLLACGN